MAVKIIETEEGLLIPKSELERLGEYEIEARSWQVTVRAKNLHEKTHGMVGKGDPEAADKLVEMIERQGIFEPWRSD